MPWYFSVCLATSMTSLLARWMAVARRRAMVCSPNSSMSGRVPRLLAEVSKTLATVVVARALATLPALWPPAPSARRNRPSSGRNRTWSSLCSLCPMSVRPAPTGHQRVRQQDGIATIHPASIGEARRVTWTARRGPCATTCMVVGESGQTSATGPGYPVEDDPTLPRGDASAPPPPSAPLDLVDELEVTQSSALSMRRQDAARARGFARLVALRARCRAPRAEPGGRRAVAARALRRGDGGPGGHGGARVLGHPSPARLPPPPGARLRGRIDCGLARGERLPGGAVTGADARGAGRRVLRDERRSRRGVRRPRRRRRGVRHPGHPGRHRRRARRGAALGPCGRPHRPPAVGRARADCDAAGRLAGARDAGGDPRRARASDRGDARDAHARGPARGGQPRSRLPHAHGRGARGAVHRARRGALRHPAPSGARRDGRDLRGDRRRERRRRGHQGAAVEHAGRRAAGDALPARGTGRLPARAGRTS